MLKILQARLQQYMNLELPDVQAGFRKNRGWDGWMASPTRWRGFRWTPGVGDGQGGLACCNSLGRKESNMTECWTGTGTEYPSDFSYFIQYKSEFCNKEFDPEPGLGPGLIFADH